MTDVTKSQILILLSEMHVQDFMICTGELAECNYVLVKDSPKMQSLMRKAGMTDAAMALLRDKDGTIDIYPFLSKMGIEYSPEKGFFVTQLYFRELNEPMKRKGEEG